jgi:hypothetical protein
MRRSYLYRRAAKFDLIVEKRINPRRWVYRNGQIEILSEEKAERLPLRGEVIIDDKRPKKPKKDIWKYVAVATAAAAAGAYFV